jgi:hypothetical protein
MAPTHHTNLEQVEIELLLVVVASMVQYSLNRGSVFFKPASGVGQGTVASCAQPPITHRSASENLVISGV